MADDERVQFLEQQVQQLQVDKIELIRSTSTEIERLRHIIRTLTNPDANIDFQDYKLEYEPLTTQEKDKVSTIKYSISSPKEYDYAPDTSTPGGDILGSAAAPHNPLLSASQHQQKTHEQMTPYNSSSNSNTKTAETKTGHDEDEKNTHRSAESIFRLNTKRMSYKGFEFGDFGFMTTDFDQLSRGHTQWVNQVMHHPVQNGIVITASDDWCVMFWRFKKWQGTDELKALKKKAALQRELRTQLQNTTPNKENNYYIDPKLQSIPGEIELLPVLKINTGLEVKGIAMSSCGTILACTCYDEEEDEGNPELQLYFDVQQRWKFKHHQFNPYFGNVGKKRENTQRDMEDMFPNQQKKKAADLNESSEQNGGRLISRRIVSLPFEPIPHCIVFSRDNKHVFVAMYSSSTILKELNEELEEEFGGRAFMDDEALSKWPDHPVSLCCVDVHTQRISECDKIWKYLGEDEHVQCMAISPNGAQIAIGSSLGQLIVTGVLNLTSDFDGDDAADEINPELQKLWSSNMLRPASAAAEESTNNDHESDGSITAIDWAPDSNWIICGHASGVIKFWNKIEAEKAQTQSQRRLSTQLNKTINQWMTSAKVDRKPKMFDCKWYLEGLHIEAINSISIRGTMMVSGADDGNVVIYDLLQTFIDEKKNSEDTSPITIGRIDKIHGGRMVNSVALSKNYSEQNLLIPTNAHFMITSGADNIVHCVNVIDVCRDTIRKNYSTQ
eukprot:52579_1